MPFNVPSEPLWAIFTPDVIRQLSLVGKPSRDLELRRQVLAAGGLNSHAPRGQALRARKAAREVYLFAAFACGLLEDPHGADLRSRLTGVDDDNFRSAMSECLAAWYLAGKRKLPVELVTVSSRLACNQCSLDVVNCYNLSSIVILG
jgi:hypothetical protein